MEKLFPKLTYLNIFLKIKRERIKIIIKKKRKKKGKWLNRSEVGDKEEDDKKKQRECGVGNYG